jgi:hypothetical protein
MVSIGSKNSKNSRSKSKKRLNKSSERNKFGSNVVSNSTS